jgi:CheY-like chemotaxis protein
MADFSSKLVDAILVVEDDADNREMLVEYLQARQLEVHAAPDGATALALAEALHPRVILMDLAMPKLDGLETTRRLRANASVRDATIVMVTARVFPTDRQAAFRAGCNFFVPKPYDVDALATFVAGLLHASRPEPQAPPKRLTLTVAPPSRTPSLRSTR